MANTFELIASATVGSGGASSIDFTSIPSTYTDLVLKISARTTRANEGDAISVSINGVTTNQSSRSLEGSGSATGSSTFTSFRTQATGANATASTFGNSEFYFPNYAGSANKSASADGVSENNGTTAFAWLTANLWSSTSAINQLTITDLNSATFVQYSTAYLYGVKNA